MGNRRTNMKKLLIVIAFFMVLLAVNTRATMYIGGISTAPPSCSTENDSVLQSSESIGGAAYFRDAVWKAQGFTLSADTLVTQFDVYIEDSEASAGTITLSVYNSNNGYPGAEISDTTVIRNSSDTPSGPGLVPFVLDTPKLLSGSVLYYIVIRASGQSTVPRIHYSNTNVYASGSYGSSSNSGGSWTLYSVDMAFKVYGCVQ